MLPGLRVGHAEDEAARTGVTVLLPEQPAVMAVDVRGGGPGTRETDALEPSTLVERAHALVLAGGSVFGLDAASEVALLLARRRRGLAVAPGLFVPVVPAAILFDLGNGGDKGWAAPMANDQAADDRETPDPPYRRLARQAFLNALSPQGLAPAEGAVGAGFGARAGSRRGGLGLARARLAGGGSVAALVAVNSFGEVALSGPPESGPVPMPKRLLSGSSTCIGAIVTDQPLTRPAARRLAMMAHDGLARTIRPVHTPFDGDSLFALSLARETPARVDPLLLAELGTLAADCVAGAVRRAVTLSKDGDWR